jgi:hypothetical protein
MNIESIEAKNKQLKYTPLIILHTIKPVDLYFTSLFATNVVWNENVDKDLLKTHKRRFTLFIDDLCKKDYRQTSLVDGAIYLHILAPGRYLDLHLVPIVHPKRFNIKHWRLEEQWWRLSRNEMRVVDSHFRSMERELDNMMAYFASNYIKYNEHYCLPSKHRIKNIFELIDILNKKPPQNYLYGRDSIPTEAETKFHAKIDHNIPEEKTMNLIKFGLSRKQPKSPRRRPPRKPTKIKENKIRISLPKGECRLSLVKVLGEYWGWDYLYTQFRFRRLDHSKSKTERVVYDNIGVAKKSMIKHLLWCFKEYKLSYKPINDVVELLKRYF